MTDFVIATVERAGAMGIFLLMLIENLFPPIPSELVMPLAGFVASRGDLGIVAVIVAGVAGSVLGTLFWYAVGRWLGQTRLKEFAARHGRWLTLSPEDVERANVWFIRHGAAALILGRLVPGVRTLISVPAGIFRVQPLWFLLLSTIGSTVWTGALAYAGFVFGANYGKVSGIVEPIGTGIFIVAIAIYLFRVATFKAQTR
ncbi:DedA family protein [Tardiphaga sp.]|jgi:membrane protein DedA with SNARE-associated domain|uniref:DedA family protein n=1 Tax=Tardiphaga sp. TaxID=1926292 RepID=UPI0037D99BB5